MMGRYLSTEQRPDQMPDRLPDDGGEQDGGHDQVTEERELG
jgi:hypothetical protein